MYKHDEFKKFTHNVICDRCSKKIKFINAMIETPRGERFVVCKRCYDPLRPEHLLKTKTIVDLTVEDVRPQNYTFSTNYDGSNL